MSTAWGVERRINSKWTFIAARKHKIEADNYAKYYNGFSHGKKTATYRVRKYVRVQE